MNTYSTKIDGVRIIKVPVFQDKRGYFENYYMESVFKELDLPTNWVQDNISWSQFGVLRGLHMQNKNPQGKLINCVCGQVFDVWVDLRPESKTFKQWESIVLGSYMAGDAEMVYLPPGLAHGFFVQSDFAVVNYKCTTPYDKESDGGILWNSCGIEWCFESDFTPIISDKDKKLPRIDEFLKIGS